MIKTKLSLDFMRKNITPRILAKELDSGRNVEITVYCDGVLVTDIFDETRVSTISKNGKPYFCSSIAEEPAISNLENGKSIWKIPSEVLEVPGITIGELRLLKKGDVISTMCFEILVEKTASKENATIPKSAVDFIIRAENAASKAEAAAMSIAQKHNSFVFDTEAHLLGWVGQNLCPMPEEISNAICEVTHNDNGTFNVVVNSTGAIPLSFGTITLSEGTYVFTRHNCDFFFGLFGYTNPIEENTVFVVEKDTLVQVGIYYQPISGDNFQNAWIQITKGETVPDTFVAYHSPYERADGITKEILSKGDLLLTEENGKPAYWWDGISLNIFSSTGGTDTVYTKAEVDSMFGDLDSALDAIIAIQEDLIDGDYTINLSAEDITLVDKSTESNYKMYVDNAKVKLEEV